MAQGTRLSPEQVQLVADSLETNPAWRAAANHAGVNEKTLWEYRQRAETYTNRNPDLPDETDPEHFFWQAVQTWIAARDRLEHRLVTGILEAIPKDWKAAHTMLKALAPQDWSERVELTGAGGGPVQISTDELRAQIEESLVQVAAKREAAGDVPEIPSGDPEWGDDIVGRGD